MQKDYSRLLPHCTPPDAIIVEAVIRNGGLRPAARSLGVPYTTLQNAVSRLEARAAPEPVVATDGVLREAPIPIPPITNDDLLNVYPVGDHHIGMLSWGRETGADYDSNIAERLLCGAIDHLVASAPPARQALVATLGDFLHYDSYESVTPSHKHQLDSDTRYSRMIDVAEECMRYLIRAALGRHERVTFVVVAGNHDPLGSLWLRKVLNVAYEREPRIDVIVEPRCYHYHRFGSCLIGFNHGDKAKPAALPGIMANDRPDDWGATRHRLWLTGHVHHDSVKDFTGCRVESVRVLPPPDAYAYGMGYRSARSMQAIVLHRKFGVISRHYFTPEMLEAA